MLGNAEAQNLLGLCYGAGKGAEKDCTKALHWYLKAAQQGQSYAQYNCGVLYQNGWGTEKDEDKAFEWYQKAAAQGHEKAKKEAEKIQTRREKEKKEDEISAMIALGTVAYDAGKFDVALQVYLKAAEQGHVGAQCKCGRMYDIGEGTAVNMAKALYWYEKAAEQGDGLAQVICGAMYHNGEGTARNVSKARYWLQKAAQSDDKKAAAKARETLREL